MAQATLTGIVNSLNGPLEQVFDRLEPPLIVTHYEARIPLAQWKVVVGHGFRGFPKRAKGKGNF